MQVSLQALYSVSFALGSGQCKFRFRLYSASFASGSIKCKVCFRFCIVQLSLQTLYSASFALGSGQCKFRFRLCTVQVSIQSLYSASFVLDFGQCKFALGSIQCNSRVKSRDCCGQRIKSPGSDAFCVWCFLMCVFSSLAHISPRK